MTYRSERLVEPLKARLYDMFVDAHNQGLALGWLVAAAPELVPRFMELPETRRRCAGTILATAVVYGNAVVSKAKKLLDVASDGGDIWEVWGDQ